MTYEQYKMFVDVYKQSHTKRKSLNELLKDVLKHPQIKNKGSNFNDLSKDDSSYLLKEIEAKIEEYLSAKNLEKLK